MMKVDKISAQVYLGMLGIPFFCAFIAGAVITGDTKLIVMGASLFFLALAFMFINNRAGDPDYTSPNDVYQFPPPKHKVESRNSLHQAHVDEEERKRLETLRWRKK